MVELKLPASSFNGNTHGLVSNRLLQRLLVIFRDIFKAINAHYLRVFLQKIR